MLDAVIFDFNGVLVDDEALHLRGFNAALAPHGLTVSTEDYEARYLGFDDRGAFDAMLRDAGRNVTEATLRALIDDKAVAYERMAAAELRVFPRAAEVLRAVAEAVPVAIVSGALRREIEFALKLMGCEAHVCEVVAAEDVSACKPDPEGYRAGLAALRERWPSIDPAGVVAVEDSPAGIEAAVGAGLSVVGVAHTYGAEVLLGAGAARVFDVVGAVDLDALASLTLRSRNL